jgi:hypothetical protein
VSVIVTIVLLNVDWICATPRLTFRRCLRFLLFAMCFQLSAVSFQPILTVFVQNSRRPTAVWLTADR